MSLRARRRCSVHNGSDEPLVIGASRVEDPRFDGPAVRDGGSRRPRAARGGRVDIQLQLPAVRVPTPAERRSRGRARLLGGDAARPCDGGAAGPARVIAPLHARECLLQALADAAAIAFTAFAPSPAGAGGDARADRHADRRAASDGSSRIQSTNLLDLRPAGAPRSTLPASGSPSPTARTEPIVARLPLVPFRCDPHAVQEDKRGTIFDARRGDRRRARRDRARGSRGDARPTSSPGSPTGAASAGRRPISAGRRRRPRRAPGGVKTAGNAGDNPRAGAPASS